MLQQASFAADVAIGTKAAVAAFTGRHFDVVVLCHAFTEQEVHCLRKQLSLRAPWARVVYLKPPEMNPNYSPQLFLRQVATNW
jgi:hypothetical protein